MNIDHSFFMAENEKDASEESVVDWNRILDRENPCPQP